MGVTPSTENYYSELFGIETKGEKVEKTAQETFVPEDKHEPASEKEKEEKEREWKDITEEVKFVCQGGKIKCKYCNPPIADIVVTSTTVMLQDKPWATVGDNDGKVNFNFMGVCNHPSQKKPFSPPPPCKAVINLGKWKDYSETMIDDYNALLVKSKIPCLISGEDLTIVHSGQISVLTNVKPKMSRKPEITNAYWINEDGEKIEKIIPNTNASLVIETIDYKPQDELNVTLSTDNPEEEKIEVTTHVNSKGVAIVKNFYKRENKRVQKPRIIEAYWRDKNEKKIAQVTSKQKAELFIRTEGYKENDEIKIIVKLNNMGKKKYFQSGEDEIMLTANVDSKGIAVIKDYNKWL